MAKDILKEAIADAKAVREVALANAKAALEEAFTPKLQSMLSAKLSEELNEEEDLEETYYEDEKEDVKEMYDEDEKMDEAYMEDEKEDLDEEIDLEEILNELELEEGDDLEETVDEAKDKDEETMDEAKDDEDVKKEELDEQGRPIYKAEEANYTGYTADRVHEGENFDLDALLEEINNLDENNEDEVNEAKDEDEVNEAKEEEVEEAVNPLANELEETKAALETVKTELNEVNLLNSKLLYVNRIFKANTLDESQKLRVVETLDKAESAKEAKLIYETIKDTFNVAKSKKASFKSKTKSLKEGLGMASKAAGTSTAPKKEVISESNDMVNRFQKLANIKINQ
jgi:hypothetical protein